MESKKVNSKKTSPCLDASVCNNGMKRNRTGRTESAQWHSPVYKTSASSEEKDQCSNEVHYDGNLQHEPVSTTACQSHQHRDSAQVVQINGQLDSKVWPDLCLKKDQQFSKKLINQRNDSFANKVRKNISLAKSDRTIILSKKSENILIKESEEGSGLHEQHCCSGTVSDLSSLVSKENIPGNQKEGKLKTFSTPKDTRVKIIDATMLSQAYALPFVGKSIIASTSNFSLQDEDFPDLSLAVQGDNKSPRCDLKLKTFDGESVRSCKKGDVNVSDIPRKPSKKQPKSNDPICIDINQVIQDSSKRNQLHQGKYFQRLEVKKCSNFLNVSNTTFKKGKHRETPVKKRLSKLKIVILEERKKKKERSETICEKMWKNDMQWLQLEPVTSYSEEGSIDGNMSSPCCQLDNITCSVLNDNEVHCQKIAFSEESNKNLSSPEKISESGTYPSQLNDIQTGKDHSQVTDRKLMSEISQSEKSVENPPYKPKAGPTVHSRKFREYCHNMKSQKLDNAVELLLKELYRFQDRVYKRDPVRAHAKRRFILGIREVKKFLKLRKLKVIIIAPDLESINSPGGLDEAVSHIKEEGNLQGIPVVFAASRQKLGFLTIKKVPISIVGIISYDGAEELLKVMLDEWKIAFDGYQEQFGTQDLPLSTAVSLDGDGHCFKNQENELVRSALEKLKEGKEYLLDSDVKAEESEVEDVQEILFNLVI